MKKSLAIAGLCLSLASGVAQAEWLNFSETATVSGLVNGINFSNATFTITGSGDTNNVIWGGIGGAWSIALTNVTFSLSTGGSGSFTDDVFAFSVPYNNAAGFSTWNHSILDTIDPIFSTYYPPSALGPITARSYIDMYDNFATSMGDLRLLTAGNSTFTASVPEPAGLLLFGTGLLGMALQRCRRT